MQIINNLRSKSEDCEQQRPKTIIINYINVISYTIDYVNIVNGYT